MIGGEPDWFPLLGRRSKGFWGTEANWPGATNFAPDREPKVVGWSPPDAKHDNIRYLRV
jgi:hypothetical protein